MVVGKITSPFGVKGWVKVHSFTQPMTNILEYQPWQVEREGQWQELKVLAGRQHGKGLAVQFEDTTDRDAAERLKSCKIAIFRSQLPPANEGEYYWADMLGMKVVNLQAQEFGVVKDFMETGANDVLVVQGERERLIPYVFNQFVISVDLQEKVITVDWDSDF